MERRQHDEGIASREHKRRRLLECGVPGYQLAVTEAAGSNEGHNLSSATMLERSRTEVMRSDIVTCSASSSNERINTSSATVHTNITNIPQPGPMSALLRSVNLLSGALVSRETLLYDLAFLQQYNSHAHGAQRSINAADQSHLQHSILNAHAADLERRIQLSRIQLESMNRQRQSTIAALVGLGPQRQELLHNVALQQQLQMIGQNIVASVSYERQQSVRASGSATQIDLEASNGNRVLQLTARERESIHPSVTAATGVPTQGVSVLGNASEANANVPVAVPGGLFRLACQSSSTSSAGTMSSLDPARNFSEPKSKGKSENVESGEGGVAKESKMVPIQLDSDKDVLTSYQCLIRKHICFFEATVGDVRRTAQGRNRQLILRQVGVVCKHCASIEPSKRPRGAVYFPARVAGIYQAAQNMVTNHFLTSCKRLPEKDRETMSSLKGKKETVWGGGKNYWTHGANLLGIVDRGGHLMFEESKDKSKDCTLDSKDSTG